MGAPAPKEGVYADTSGRVCTSGRYGSRRQYVVADERPVGGVDGWWGRRQRGVSSRAAAAAPAPPSSHTPRRALAQWRHAVGGLAAHSRRGGKSSGGGFFGARPSPRPPPPLVAFPPHGSDYVCIQSPTWLFPTGQLACRGGGRGCVSSRRARRCARRGGRFFPPTGEAWLVGLDGHPQLFREAQPRCGPSGSRGGVKREPRALAGSFSLWPCGRQPPGVPAGGLGSGRVRRRTRPLGAPAVQSVALAVRGRDGVQTDG